MIPVATNKSYKAEQVCLYKQLVLLCLRQIKEIHFCYSLKNLLNTFYESCHFIPARISWLITRSLIITLPMQIKRASGHRQVKVVHAVSRNSSLEQITNFKFRASNISYNLKHDSIFNFPASTLKHESANCSNSTGQLAKGTEYGRRKTIPYSLILQ